MYRDSSSAAASTHMGTQSVDERVGTRGGGGRMYAHMHTLMPRANVSRASVIISRCFSICPLTRMSFQ